MLHSETGAAHGVEPVYVSAQVYAYVSPSEAHITIILSTHHIKFFLNRIKWYHTGIRCVYRPVLASFLGGHHYHTIRASCSVNRRCSTIFKNVKRCNVVGIDIGQIATRHAIYHNQRTKTRWARRHTTYLDARLVVGVAGSRIGNRHTRHLALNHHGGVERTHGQKVFFTHMGNGWSKFFLVHRTVANHHHLVQKVALFLHYNIHHLAACHLFTHGFISHVWEYQGGWTGSLYGIVAINVGDGTIVGFVHFHANAYQRVATGIFHRTGYLCLLGWCRYADTHD